MTDEITIRPARMADVAAIVGLLADDPLGASREDLRDPLPDAYRAAFAEIDADPRQILVVAEDAGTVVGTLQLTLLPGLSRRGALRAQIEAVRVARGHRNAGLGRRLFTWAIDTARARGAVLVQLTTDKTRADAHRFYENLGFVASHEGYKLAL